MSLYAAYPEDFATLRERKDGQWRTDEGQASHERWLAKIAAENERRRVFAVRAKDDPILSEMVEVVSRAGFAWNEKYDFVELVEKLVLRHAARPTPEGEETAR